MRRAANAVLIAALTWSRVAAAFDLGFHEDFTTRALSQAGFVFDSTRLVVNFNLYVDIGVNTPGQSTPLLQEVHFDDRFRFSTHKALHDKLDGMIGRLGGLDCSTSDGLYRYAAALGLVEHSLQDYHAHSNHAELLEHYGPPGPTTFADVLKRPPTDPLLKLWLRDVSDSATEALISGAYFTSPPPRTADTNGNPKELTHAILNKDKLLVGGDYLYPSLSRTQMAFDAGANATKDSVDVLAKFQSANGACFSTLVTYQFGFFEAAFNSFSNGEAYFFGTMAGHWKSGNQSTRGDGLEVDNSLPTLYPDQETPVHATYRWHVVNTGDRPIQQIRLQRELEPTAAVPGAAPSGWSVTVTRGEIEWRANTALKRGEFVDLEVQAAAGGGPGKAFLKTETGRSVAVAAPVAPSLMLATLLRSAALMNGIDEGPVLDAISVPLAHRHVPDWTTRGAGSAQTQSKGTGCGCGLANRSGLPTSALVMSVLFLGLLLRRSNRRGA